MAGRRRNQVSFAPLCAAESTAHQVSVLHHQAMRRDVLMLYELLEEKADAFIRWPRAAAMQHAHCRVDKSAALQALVESQEWDKATRWRDTSPLQCYCLLHESHHLPSSTHPGHIVRQTQCRSGGSCMIVAVLNSRFPSWASQVGCSYQPAAAAQRHTRTRRCPAGRLAAPDVAAGSAPPGLGRRTAAVRRAAASACQCCALPHLSSCASGWGWPAGSGRAGPACSGEPAG